MTKPRHTIDRGDYLGRCHICHHKRHEYANDNTCHVSPYGIHDWDSIETNREVLDLVADANKLIADWAWYESEFYSDHAKAVRILREFVKCRTS